MTYDSLLARSLACALSGWMLSAPCLGADMQDADIAELKRAMAELQDQARVLADRVKELEATKAAQADATRSIIRDTVSTLGSKINQSVALSGAVEMRASRAQDFAGNTSSALRFNTAELDFDIQANPWSSASLVLGFVDGGDVRFPNTQGFDSGVDRITVDTASITVGDLQRFPLYLKTGRMTLGFGSSTGVHRADVLSIENPLTTEAFETRREAIGFGFGLPTPPITRALPAVRVPPVRPLVLAPLVGAVGRGMGYVPLPERPPPLPSVNFAPDPPPFYGDVFFYEGHNVGTQRDFSHNVNGRLGYRTRGHCGMRYSEIRSTDFCPWSLDFSVDYLTSVFDSRFLSTEYRPFLPQLGTVRGMASTLKMSLGPVQLVGEWNGATERAVFLDDAGTPVSILPSAWQVALGYQFDWNPWVESVGAQGTYLSLGYSESRDLAGAIRVLNGTNRSRVGALPYSRWTLTAGEWVQEGLKVQLEYSHTTDYPLQQGGTGARAKELQMTLTYSW